MNTVAAPARRWQPLGAVRARIQAFWINRIRRTDSVVLHQRNLYILPTRPGWMLALTLMVLLVTSINYQLNLGYLLTFLLAGSAAVGVHVCHANLRGLQMHLEPLEPVFAGHSASVGVRLHNARATPRYAVALAVADSAQWCWTDLPAQGESQVRLAFTPETRGRCAVPPVTVQTLYPLGNFRVWTIWRPASTLLVYPAPEFPPPPLPPGRSTTSDDPGASRHRSNDHDGVRAYRAGDPRKLVLWKKAAKNGTLVSRDTEATQPQSLWLDLADCSGGTLEQRLSRLCAWVLLADRLQIDYGLRLPGHTLAPDCGSVHRAACLQALALHQGG